MNIDKEKQSPRPSDKYVAKNVYMSGSINPVAQHLLKGGTQISNSKSLSMWHTDVYRDMLCA